MIPVLRPVTGKWEFATVERAASTGQDDPSFFLGASPNKNAGSNTHYVRFMDSKCEWVVVEKSAYDQYIRLYQNNPWALVVIDDRHGGAGASFGNDDDVTMEDPNDEYDHECISRQLEKSFDAMEGDFGMDQHPSNSGTLTKYKRNAHETTMALSPSLSPGTRTLDESPFTTPNKMYTRNRDGGSITTTSPKYSQKLWTPEVSTRLTSSRSSLSRRPN